MKVSPACQHCYAETWAKRTGNDVWGPKASRRFFTDKHWESPQVWNKEAARNNVRYRVFCASMADVFEKRKDLEEPRERLWRLIESTKNLDWLLLTKRIENVESMVGWGKAWPDNVWLGTTIEDQEYAELRLPILLKQKANIKFISAEPLLGDIRLGSRVKGRLDWVIAGGESGGHSRPMSLAAVRRLRDESQKYGIKFLFKQWGNWVPADQVELKKQTGRTDIFNGLIRLSKADAGRMLDGRTWDEYPSLKGIQNA